MLLFESSVTHFFPEYRSTQVAWQALEPFAAWLMQEVQPARVVELGSYRGDSFFTFLQASEALPAVKEVWAIDSWQGDIHTGPYGEAVYNQFMREFERRADPRARHLRCLFSEAAKQFKDRSIDLLHIDGAHDYASVREDYETWLPKMRAGGIILFHDTLVRDEAFGVWKLWQEISAERPAGRCLNLPFSNGLGVLCLGKAVKHDIHRLCAAPAREQAVLCDALESLGQRLIRQSQFEYTWYDRAGLPVAEDHVFARGEELALFRQLAAAAQEASEARLAAGLASQKEADEARLAAQEAELAALRKQLAVLSEENADIIARAEAAEQRLAALDGVTGRLQRLEKAGSEVAALNQGLAAHGLELDQIRQRTSTALAAAVARQDEALRQSELNLRDQIEARAEALGQDLLGPRAPELLAAIAADLPKALMPQLTTLYQGLDPLVRESLRMKNDAQDDAIISIGAKTDAHEQALTYLIEELRKLLAHPFLR